MSDLLAALRKKGELSDLDVQFARFMARLSPGSGPELLLASALASRAVSSLKGVCLDLAETIQDLPEGLVPADLPPSAEAWRAALQICPVVAKPGEFKPLVLDGHGRLYLYRYWDYERRLAEQLLGRASSRPAAVDEGRLSTALDLVFGKVSPGELDLQRVAAAVAALKNLCVISGGPGTGKTYTVIRALVALRHLVGKDIRVALAAPTGKAAARLAEVAREDLPKLTVGEEVKASLPTEASTIHRLLGWRSDGTFARNRENPLPLDVLVVDEASMVPLPLMARLVDALPRDARLILLGDKDQLASVEAGRVLGDVCAREMGFSEKFAECLMKASGLMVLVAAAPGTLADSVVVLTHNYRSGTSIGELARLVNAGKTDEALALATSGGDGHVTFRELPRGALRKDEVSLLAAAYRDCLEAMRDGKGAREVLALFNSSRVLSAVRRGRRGVAEINRLAESSLEAEGLLSSRDRFYEGRPVTVTVNDYTLRLFNGDTGVVLRDPEAGEGLRAFFEETGDGPRAVVPSRLPEHETAWAMTVHKAQGSEFDRVVLVLPDEDSPVLSRELLYTAITRARKEVEIWGSRDVFRKAVDRPTERSSGLRDRLWGGASPSPAPPATSAAPRPPSSRRS